MSTRQDESVKAAPSPKELGAFVRTRREQARPDQLGLISIGRRRAPGLRREELAQLAGVGLTWLTWLEQGREINPSREVLCSIARALRLTDDERAYMSRLAGTVIPKITVDVDDVPDRIAALVDAIAFPACVINYRLEVPYLNSQGRQFFLYGHEDDRNAARRVFNDQRYRALFTDIDHLEKLVVGIFRLSLARHPTDPSLLAVISGLTESSPTFARLWQERHIIHPAEQGTVKLHHPDFGDTKYEAQTLMLNENADVSIYVAIPTT